MPVTVLRECGSSVLPQYPGIRGKGDSSAVKRVYYWQGIPLVDTPLAPKTRSDILVSWYVYGMCSRVLQTCDNKHIHSKGMYYDIYMCCIGGAAVIFTTVIIN